MKNEGQKWLNIRIPKSAQEEIKDYDWEGKKSEVVRKLLRIFFNWSKQREANDVDSFLFSGWTLETETTIKPKEEETKKEEISWLD
jgi:hypothetical protein